MPVEGRRIAKGGVSGLVKEIPCRRQTGLHEPHSERHGRRSVPASRPGSLPDCPLHGSHEGSDVVTLRSTIGAAARLKVFETDSGRAPPRFTAYSGGPFEPILRPVDGGSEVPGDLPKRGRTSPKRGAAREAGNFAA
jgi:hypothetical protein